MDDYIISCGYDIINNDQQSGAENRSTRNNQPRTAGSNADGNGSCLIDLSAGYALWFLILEDRVKNFL